MVRARAQMDAAPAEWGRERGSCARTCDSIGHHRQTRSGLGQISVEPDRCRANIYRCRAGIDQNWPAIGQTQPDFGHRRPNVGQNWSGIGQQWSSIVRHRSRMCQTHQGPGPQMQLPSCLRRPQPSIDSEPEPCNCAPRHFAHGARSPTGKAPPDSNRCHNIVRLLPGKCASISRFPERIRH